MVSLFGEKNPAALLTKRDVKEIRKLRKKFEYSTRSLSENFGISERQVRRILSRENWSTVK